eukprot:30761-Eustigmatos_ZCMA.PRE.1
MLANRAPEQHIQRHQIMQDEATFARLEATETVIQESVYLSAHSINHLSMHAVWKTCVPVQQ